MCLGPLLLRAQEAARHRRHGRHGRPITLALAGSWVYAAAHIQELTMSIHLSVRLAGAAGLALVLAAGFGALAPASHAQTPATGAGAAVTAIKAARLFDGKASATITNAIVIVDHD